MRPLITPSGEIQIYVNGERRPSYNLYHVV